MEHFKIKLETGKKKNEDRTMFVRMESIVDALGTSKKIRDAKLVSIVPISYEEYMKGVDRKYSSSYGK